jgi:hypothetical protein
MARTTSIESMNGARFVYDTLELYGWSVEIADAQNVKGACINSGSPPIGEVAT